LLPLSGSKSGILIHGSQHACANIRDGLPCARCLPSRVPVPCPFIKSAHPVKLAHGIICLSCLPHELYLSVNKSTERTIRLACRAHTWGHQRRSWLRNRVAHFDTMASVAMVKRAIIARENSLVSPLSLPPVLTPTVLASLPHDDLGPMMRTTAWVMTSLAFAFLATRMYCKRVRQRGIQIDDYFLIASWVGRPSPSQLLPKNLGGQELR
jgi:hypothetical protein